MNGPGLRTSLEHVRPRTAYDAMRDLQADVRDWRDRGSGRDNPPHGQTSGTSPSPAAMSVDVEKAIFPLPAPRTAGSIVDVLQRRASVRTYAKDPVTLDQIAAVLKAPAVGDAKEWPQEAARPLRLRLLAWRVSGLTPGIYSYCGERHALQLDGPAPDPVVEGPTLALQPEFADAPFLVFITGNLAAALQAHGSAGYTQLLLRGGAAGQRAWLGAIGSGLCGVTFAGFLPAAASRYLGANGYEACCLLTFAGGRPAATGPGPSHASGLHP